MESIPQAVLAFTTITFWPLIKFADALKVLLLVVYVKGIVFPFTVTLIWLFEETLETVPVIVVFPEDRLLPFEGDVMFTNGLGQL